MPNTKYAATVKGKDGQVYKCMDSEAREELNAMSTATASDVDKALSPKTVVNGKVTEWQFVDASSGGGGELSAGIKAALMACFQNVAWAGNDGYYYYSNLYEALYGVPPTPLDPYEYYDYIQSDGTAFIDTGLDAQVYGADTYEKELKFVMTEFSRSNGDYPYVTGCTNNWGTSGFYICGETTSTNKSVYILINKQYSNTTITLSSRDELATIKTVDKTTYYNGTLIYTGSNATQAISYAMNIPLFTIANGENGAISYDGYYVNNPCPCKIYEYTVKNSQNDTVVAHMIPAKRKSDNVVGMWDTVRKQFFVNANQSGAFTVGNDE